MEERYKKQLYGTLVFIRTYLNINSDMINDKTHIKGGVQNDDLDDHLTPDRRKCTLSPKK